jgi:hypothetical protein
MKEFELLRTKIIELVDKAPNKAVIILTAWLKQPAKSKKKAA